MTPRKPSSGKFHRGVSLTEVIVALGVVAVVAPLSLAALLTATRSNLGAKAEARCPAMVESCLEELQLAMKGHSQYLRALQSDQDFPGGEETLCLAFDRTGSIIDKVDRQGYQAGVGELDKTDVIYLATVKGKVEQATDGGPDLITVTIGIENPARAPQTKRSRQEFLTKLP